MLRTSIVDQDIELNVLAAQQIEKGLHGVFRRYVRCLYEHLGRCIELKGHNLLAHAVELRERTRSQDDCRSSRMGERKCNRLDE